MSNNASKHPLYRAADRILASRNTTFKQLGGLVRAFNKQSLPVPVDLQLAVTGNGFILDGDFDFLD